MPSGETSRICIIGGGAAGLSTLKILLEAEEYKASLWELTVFEAREQLGGVWLQYPADDPASPMYDSLTTNLPHPLMCFTSYPFPPETPLFPRASVVLQYLQDYAKDFGLLNFINFNTRVEEAVWSGESWQVRLSTGIIRQFDRIIVAVGHYSAPRYPDILGLQHWIKSGRASHSISYRNPQRYKNKQVLVIGGGPSGQDISAEISTVTTKVYHSVHLERFRELGLTKPSNVDRRGDVVRFDEDGAVTFHDGSTVVIDHAIVATGYEYVFSFLPQIRMEHMPKIPPIPSYALNSNYNVFPLAKHLFPLQDDFPAESIAFAGMLVRVVPFPLFELQARLISSVFSNSRCLDWAREMDLVKDRYGVLQGRWGDDLTTIARHWHVFQDQEMFSYRLELLESTKAEIELFPEGWFKEVWDAKLELRSAWIALVRKGEADEWVRGVGKGGQHEWTIMMRRLLETTRLRN